MTLSDALWTDTLDGLWTDTLRGLWYPEIAPDGRKIFVCASRPYYFEIKNRQFLFVSNDKSYYFECRSRKFSFVCNKKLTFHQRG